MPHHEEFADPVVVPGPNIRSRSVDTEAVEEDTAALVEDREARFCPTCHRVLPSTALVCPDDGAALTDLPPPR
ncbi:MAG: hypothetical protein WEB03_08490 [Nitriliruptor sp.]|uniref:hypothetical protein n=1 Tax=Nitriliruptor sp. TaxID=2448056 RepID=UPI0034A018F7